MLTYYTKGQKAEFVMTENSAVRVESSGVSGNIIIRPLVGRERIISLNFAPFYTQLDDFETGTIVFVTVDSGFGRVGIEVSGNNTVQIVNNQQLISFKRGNRLTPPIVPTGDDGVLFMDENRVLVFVDTFGVIRELSALDLKTTASVLGVSSQTVTEGSNAVFTVTLNKPSIGQIFNFDVGGTATGGTDYGLPLVLNNGVIISGTTFFIPSGVTAFTATAMTSSDVVAESPETIIFTVGGVGGTTTIIDASTAQISNISSTTTGDTTVYTITLDKPSVAGQLFTPVLSGAA